MLLKALDLLRNLGWGILNFIFSTVDTLFEVLKSLNCFNIIDSIAENTIFSNFYKGIIIISITLLGLFSIWRFIIKIIEPDEGLSASQIVKEIGKCGLFVILSTFLFSQMTLFSIKLSSFTGDIFSESNISLSDNMLSLYIDHTKGYKESDEFENENILDSIQDKTFTDKKLYNDKYTTSSRWILPDEQDYKYSINWIMAIVVGAFFLYALFFSGMMLARRQIEFLFLFAIAPIIFSTSVGNKQRRNTVIEQLVSLTVQGAVVLLIISLTALVIQQIQMTTFFNDSILKDMLIKSILYIGCGAFLLAGSQVVNRFIGSNVSANSGREQMMAMMSFGRTLGTVTSVATHGAVGTGLVGSGLAMKGLSKFASIKESSSGNEQKTNGSTTISLPSNESSLQDIGNYIDTSTKLATNSQEEKTKNKPTISSRLNNLGSMSINAGFNSLNSAVNQIIPNRGFYRRRFRNRGDE